MAHAVDGIILFHNHNHHHNELRVSAWGLQVHVHGYRLFRYGDIFLGFFVGLIKGRYGPILISSVLVDIYILSRSKKYIRSPLLQRPSARRTQNIIHPIISLK
jgi:hypothetical protein